MTVHVDIHLDLDGDEFEVRGLGEPFLTTHVLSTEASTTYCTADQLRQLKAALDSYLAGLPVVVDSEGKEDPVFDTEEDSIFQLGPP